MTNRVYGFNGEYSFLSNFWLEVNGQTAEHTFQAAKAEDPEEAKWILESGSPGEAKRRGRAVKLRPDWDDVKRETMLNILRRKFSDPELRERLVNTGDAELIEANHWNDLYWGVDRDSGEGQNWLGKTLMQVRDEIRGIG